MISEMTRLARLLEISSIDGAYRHVPKHVTAGEALELPEATLKWYEVHPVDRPVPGELTRLARTYLMKTPLEVRGLGFVVLHRCGRDFYFLIVCSWRNSNELWETVFYKDGDAMSGFAPFPRDGEHKPTLCVWELVPVWHEQEAWVRFLKSKRDEAAAHQWLLDRFSGSA